MSETERRRLAIILGLLMPAGLLAAGASIARPVGYWTCSGDRWIAVGAPGYAKPLKRCGSTLPVPRNRPDCESAGGRWGPAGLFPKPICRVPTHDGGRLCGDSGECESLCLSPLSPDQRDMLRQGHKLRLLGRCAPVVPLFGCLAIVKKGVVTGLECRD